MNNCGLLIGAGVVAVLILAYVVSRNKKEGFSDNGTGGSCIGAMDVGEASFTLNQDLIGIQYSPPPAQYKPGAIRLVFSTPIDPVALQLSVATIGRETTAIIAAFVPEMYNGVAKSQIMAKTIADAKTATSHGLPPTEVSNIVNADILPIIIGNGLVNSLTGVNTGMSPALSRLMWSASDPKALTIGIGYGDLMEMAKIPLSGNDNYTANGLTITAPMQMVGKGTVRFRLSL